jgi:predicted XRE-type DNA-binding protein
MSFPNEKTLKKMDKILSKHSGSYVLSPNAEPLDRFKYDLCQRIVRYKKANNLTQRQLAKTIGIDEARISEILHYKIWKYSIERLMLYLQKLDNSVIFKVA